MRKKVVSLVAISVVPLVIILFFSYPAEAALNVEVPESDSTILARHIHEVKVEYAIEEFSDHSFNSHYSDKELDSLLAESGTHITGGKVVYSPDSLFMIFVVDGEGCGAYCNPFWETWFHFNDGSGMALSDPGYDNVTSIEKLSDGKYLVWEDTYGRSGSVGYYTTTVTLLSIQAHEIKYYPFPSIPSQERMGGSNDPQGSFSVYTSTEEEEGLMCDFNPESQKLVYTYSLDHYWRQEEDTCFTYAGSFVYKNGLFEFQDEICKTKNQ